MYLEMLSPLQLTNVTLGDRRELPAGTKCPPAAQRKQAKRACIYIYIQSSSFNSKDISIYIYICNELIEETAGRRRLIFGMWESFGYGSSKF